MFAAIFTLLICLFPILLHFYKKKQAAADIIDPV